MRQAGTVAAAARGSLMADLVIAAVAAVAKAKAAVVKAEAARSTAAAAKFCSVSVLLCKTSKHCARDPPSSNQATEGHGHERLTTTNHSCVFRTVFNATRHTKMKQVADGHLAPPSPS